MSSAWSSRGCGNPPRPGPWLNPDEKKEPLVQTLVIIHNPPDIATWSEERRLARWERVMRWHEHVRELRAQGKITHAWGSHGLGDAERPESRHHTLVVVYS